MRTMLRASGVPASSVGGALACYSASLPAAPAVLLEKARLVPSDGAPEGGFGRSIAIDGNVAVVTANPQAATMGAGPDMPSAAYVFERQASGAWIQTAKLSSGLEGDLYGIDVAVDGNVIVIGAVFGGVAYVYEKVGGTWQQTAVLGTWPTGATVIRSRSRTTSSRSAKVMPRTAWCYIGAIPPAGRGSPTMTMASVWATTNTIRRGWTSRQISPSMAVGASTPSRQCPRLRTSTRPVRAATGRSPPSPRSRNRVPRIVSERLVQERRDFSQHRVDRWRCIPVRQRSMEP